MIDALKGKIYPTAVGSLPFTDPKQACEKILKSFKALPFWPQLTRRSFLENMYVQYAEKIPGIVVDLKEKRIYVDTRKDSSAEFEKLYERFLENDVDFFSISSQRAEGLYAFTDIVKGLKAKPAILKGQTIGPVSFGLTVTDDKRRALFYDIEQREALIKTLTMRARWQVRKLSETGLPCIIFIDEPYLSSIGSSYVSLKKQEAAFALNEMIDALHQEGASCGVHCCGNTDWGFLLGTGLDILNFDAYNFYEGIALYPDELSAFLKRGGMLAWGLVPTNEDVLKENDSTLLGRFEKALALLAKKGIKKEDILNSMIVTPSCGMGLLDEYLADMIIEQTVRLSEKLKGL